MLEAKPSEPTITTSFGFEISTKKMNINETKYEPDILTRSAEESFNCFHEYGEAKRKKEDAVDQGSKNFGSVPSVRIASIVVFCLLLLRKLHIVAE